MFGHIEISNIPTPIWAISAAVAISVTLPLSALYRLVTVSHRLPKVYAFDIASLFLVFIMTYITANIVLG